MQKSVPEHRAVVRALNHKFIQVQLLPDDGSRDCNGCALSALCSGSDGTPQPVFDVPLRPGTTPPAVGRVVRIRAAASVRRLAATALFLIPATLFLAAIFICKSIGAPAWLQVIIAMLLVAIYYLILYFRTYRRRLWQIVFVEPE